MGCHRRNLPAQSQSQVPRDDHGLVSRVPGHGLDFRLTSYSNWLLNWAIAYATPYMVETGPGNAGLEAKVFFVWGSFCFVCIFFVWSMIYETKGLSLEQVDELYAKVPKAWQSQGFVPTVSFQEVQDVGPGRGQSLSQIEATAHRKRSVVHDEEFHEPKY